MDRTGPVSPGGRHDPHFARGLHCRNSALRSCFAALLCVFTSAVAQAPGGVIRPGDAAVSGFSGSIGPTSVAPGVDPADQTVIDPNGWSMRVLDLQNPGAPPPSPAHRRAQALGVTAAQTGQLFGLALDSADPPNVYAAATSAYGLPIISSERACG